LNTAAVESPDLLAGLTLQAVSDYRARAMMLISAQVNVEAAHFTPFGEEDDVRRQIHGHSYLVRAWVEAEPNVEDLDRLRDESPERF
jgi:hypothetical protein